MRIFIAVFIMNLCLLTANAGRAQSELPTGPAFGVHGGQIRAAEIEQEGVTENAEVEETYMGGFLTIPFRPGIYTSFFATASVMQHDFDWTPSGFASGAFSDEEGPWETLYSGDLDLRFVNQWDETWSVLVGGHYGYAWEEDWEDAQHFGGRLALIYESLNRFNLLVGVKYTQAQEESFVLPWIRLTLNSQNINGTTTGWSAQLGIPYSELRYTMFPFLDIYAGVGTKHKDYPFRIFRLDKENRVLPSGLVKIKGYEGGLYLDLKPANVLSITLGLTYHFNREWEVRDEKGNNIKDITLEDVTGFFVSGELHF